MFNKILNSISTVSTSLTNCGAPSGFKFVIGEKLVESAGVFEMYLGKPKSGIINIPGLPIADALSSVEVTVLVFKKTQQTAHLSAFAANAMRKLVSLRHPYVLRVLDSGENDNGVYLATERVFPLQSWLKRGDVPLYGLYQIAKALEFVGVDAKLVHGAVDPANVFVTENGGFRLAGFELARTQQDAASALVYDKRAIGNITRYRFEARDVRETDLIGYALLIAYIGGSSSPIGEGPMTLSGVVESVSRSVSAGELKQLVVDVGQTRSVGASLSAFRSSESVTILTFLESIQLRTEQESIKFLDNLPLRLPRLDSTFKSGVLLDSLLTSVLSLASLVPAAIPSLVAIACGMDKPAFAHKLEPRIAQLFAVQDRGIRFRLLAGLPELLPILNAKTIESSILVETLSGFTDSHPSIREQTLRAVVDMSAVVSPGAVERRVVPHLVKMLKDPEATIRTNAIVSIAKVAKLIESETKQAEVLGVAISAGLKDTFGPAKLVGLESLAVWVVKTEVNASELATRYLPLVCGLLVDSDGGVAGKAADVMNKAVEKIRKVMPTTSGGAGCATVGTTSYQNSTRVAEPTFPSAPVVAPSKAYTAPAINSVTPAYGMSLNSSSRGPVPVPKDSLLDFGGPSPKDTMFDFVQLPAVGTSRNNNSNQPTSKKLSEADFDSFWDGVASPTNAKNSSLI